MVAQILGIKSLYYQVERGKGRGEKSKTLFMKLPFMGICWFHTVELDFPNNPNYGYPLDPTSKLKKKGHIDGKDSYKSVTPLARSCLFANNIHTVLLS